MHTFCADVASGKEVDDKAKFTVLWFYDKFLPAIAGVKNFTPQERFYQRFGDVNEEGKVIMTVTNEAFGILLLDNFHSRWTAQLKWKVQYGKKAKYPEGDNMPAEFKSKWSDPASGQKQFGGWLRAGLKHFARLLNVTKKLRELDAEVGCLQTFVFEEVRKTHGITGDSYTPNKKGKRKAEEISPEGDAQEEDILAELDE